MTIFSHDRIAKNLHRICIESAVRNSESYEQSQNREQHHSIMTALRKV